MADEGVRIAIIRDAIVQHRAQQMLEDDRNIAAIARQDGNRRSESATRADPRQRDPCGVDAERRPFGEHPGKRTVTIFNWRWKRVFGRETVIDEDHGVQIEGRRPAGGRHPRRRSRDEAAAVNVADRGQFGRPVGATHDHIEVLVPGAQPQAVLHQPGNILLFHLSRDERPEFGEFAQTKLNVGKQVDPRAQFRVDELDGRWRGQVSVSADG